MLFGLILVIARDRKGGRFRLRYVPEETGEVKIGVQHENSRSAYEMILVYRVEPNQELI